MSQDKRILDREAVRAVIQQWNTNRLDLFELSEPDENLLFHGVMRFYFQDTEQKYATKCIRVASDATVSDVIDTLIEKFRPDMRMLSVPNYALYEVYANGEERRLNPDEKPLLVQLNWHIDDREGRFFLKNIDNQTNSQNDINFKRKLSKREKREQKKKEKLLNMDGSSNEYKSNEATKLMQNDQVAGKLYTEMPETSFTRSISNPEAVMRRRRQQKLEKKLQQFRSRDGGPDTGGTLKIYGESLCKDVPYKTLLLSIRDCSQAVVREMLSKYGLDKVDSKQYCLVQSNVDGSEYILDDDECPLSILMNHPTSRGSIMFHVRRRPADSQTRRRKKKPTGTLSGVSNLCFEREGPVLVEVTHNGDSGRRIKLGCDPVEVGSANTNCLQLFGPSIQPRHCLITLKEGACAVTPLHTDALTFVNGHQITQPTIIHNGSVIMFGRVASYRFLESPIDGQYNLALSQSQLDSICLYEGRSLASPDSLNGEDISGSAINNGPHLLNGGLKMEFGRTNDKNKFLKHNFSQDGEVLEESIGDENLINEGNLETKSVSSVNSNSSINRKRAQKVEAQNENLGQEPILPAVLEFPETYEEEFLKCIISDLDVNIPHFKLAPVYTLYLCARYRASTHYRPELQPTERAHKLTLFLHHVANLIYNVVQEKFTDVKFSAFWMANSSEFLHFLKSDRHISAFSVQSQEVLAECVQKTFQNLVNCFRIELSQTLTQFLSETIDQESAAGLVLTVLGSAMALLRRCRVNAALTIQLFSQLFHYINVTCFNTIIVNSHLCTAEWGRVMIERLQLLEFWAERQGLELAADCHLAKINQCVHFLQASKTSVEEIQQLVCSCFRLNSLQIKTLVQNENISRNFKETAIRMAESVADELARADGREICLEESPELHLALLLPDDGFSCDVVRRIPSGLVDFLNPLQDQKMCRLAAQPSSIGLWTVYMHQFHTRSPSSLSNKLSQPEVQIIRLHKNQNGMGLSIVAAKGAGQDKLGIYIKSVVPGGAADIDGRLQAGDQLLRVDNQSLIGITQERAADYLVRTGPIVSLEIAKQGAIYHGLATLLQQPSPITQQDSRRASEQHLMRNSGELQNIDQLITNSPLLNSKSVPVLHRHTSTYSINHNKARSTYSLTSSFGIPHNDQGFYQNLPKHKSETNDQQAKTERQSVKFPPSTTTSAIGQNYPTTNGKATQVQQFPLVKGNLKVNSNSLPSNYFVKSNNTSKPSYHQHQMTILNHGHEENISKNNTHNNTVQNQQLYRDVFQSALENRSNFVPKSNSEVLNTHKLQIQRCITPSMPSICNIYPSQEKESPLKNKMTSQSMLNIIPTADDNNSKHSVENDISILNECNSSQYKTNVLMHTLENDQTKNQSICPQVQSRVTSNQQQSFGHGTIQLPMQQAFSSENVQLPINAKLHYQNRNALPNMYGKNIEEKPPLPPSSTHPLYKHTQKITPSLDYVASSLEPPKGGYVPVTNVCASHKNFISASNPWERELREREIHLRREQIRQWREQQIFELSSNTNRSAQQEEQLKTLILERDFERRALEIKEQEDESEFSYDKENVQEMLLSNNSTSATNTSIEGVSGSDKVIAADSLGNTLSINMQKNLTKSVSLNTDEKNNSVGHVAQLNSTEKNVDGRPFKQSRNATQIQPKSILKNNRYDNTLLCSPSKSQKSASFADNFDDIMISNVSKNLSDISLHKNLSGSSTAMMAGNVDSIALTPPMPPERNSSFFVMSQQQSRNGSMGNHTDPIVPKFDLIVSNTSNIDSTITSNPADVLQRPVNTESRENRRVSFHDKENCKTPILEGSVIAKEHQDAILFDCGLNDFMMSSMPANQDGSLWNTTVQSTPGVIGAQEVYRDPRQRRLAEKQQQQQQNTDSLPEKLSFKEKMKMFGEDHTPKDKIKISRAQRDIDAVH